MEDMMPNKRKLLSVMLLAVVLAIPAAAVLAAPSAGTTHTVITETVNWTLPAGQCPNLPAGLSVSGSGQRFKTIDVTENADLSTRIVENDTIQGTAVGSNGTKYTFYYNNVAIFAIPPSGSAGLTMYDLFLLQDKQGQANNRYVLKNGFAWRWTYQPPADPFAVWPPANFQNISTFGSPLTENATALCDAL
jgi:hypothetical protein